MNAGRYRVPVTLEQPVQTVAADGSATLVYVEAGTGFAAIKAKSQRQDGLEGRFQGIVTHEIRLRYRDDLTGGWRIKARNRVFRLLAVTDPDLKSRELLCLAEEEDA